MSLIDKVTKTKPLIAATTSNTKRALSKKESDTYTKEGTPDAEALSEIKLASAHTQLQLHQQKVVRERAHNEGIKQDQVLRDKYAGKAYKFVWAWSGVLFLLLFLSGSKSLFGFEFELSETVLIALITGVTVNILAVFLSVMNNLFPTKTTSHKSSLGSKTKGVTRGLSENSARREGRPN